MTNRHGIAPVDCNNIAAIICILKGHTQILDAKKIYYMYTEEVT